MEDLDEIVVFRQFNDAIAASIAKSKLDAYGIPCFLTEENMAGLYPGQQGLPFHVRLHVFKKDVVEASQIFMEMQPGFDTNDVICPKCKSKKVERDFPQAFSLKPLNSLMVLFFGVFFPHKKVNHCLDCDYEF